MSARDTDGIAPEETGSTALGAEPARQRPSRALAVAGVLVVVVLGALVRFLEQTVPELAEGSSFERVASSIEFPVYAIALGLLGNLVLSRTGLRDRISGGFRTEFFIKTGLVLLGASINLTVLATAAGPAIVQGVLLITAVFSFSWWLGGKLGLDEKLRALLSAAVSICGVSAAIAAAGAVQAKREQLAYAASLVIVFALPSIFLLPWLAGLFGLSDAVAGAWIGGNIDTTAAVAASGAIVGEDALQIATIVKTTQNALIGFVAVALTAYFALRVERRPGSARPSIGDFWQRFPKFVLGFVAASVIGTLWVKFADDGKADISTINDLRTWFLIFAFVSIGLEFSARGLREAGWRPIVVFGSATVVNIVVALGLATVLFGNFELPSQG
ncbi:YeiH family protein [Rhodococcus sp. CH91]|uniref:YeiH family protein n=1 Tax=Rhodococcus sp. CH91 TaxID=2910256 RepID=UPI001F4A63FA|nr:putative sulfate exporter family transporter [Rhodococcus sp. CH91]